MYSIYLLYTEIYYNEGVRAAWEKFSAFFQPQTEKYTPMRLLGPITRTQNLSCLSALQQRK